MPWYPANIWLTLTNALLGERDYQKSGVVFSSTIVLEDDIFRDGSWCDAALHADSIPGAYLIKVAMTVPA